ncbi:hypothetical protein ARMGADRAFT_1038741 [Armillaria gallica]|uniref:Uncharacterized protein n=1 Tax=Armillaria gallica TaxID=47427 RepID=A0A2H3CSW6_ARMGA|nr:hypothetical protein ARMGADRAFT_1038741 [Armillaria gallica]
MLENTGLRSKPDEGDLQCLICLLISIVGVFPDLRATARRRTFTAALPEKMSTFSYEDTLDLSHESILFCYFDALRYADDGRMHAPSFGWRITDLQAGCWESPSLQLVLFNKDHARERTFRRALGREHYSGFVTPEALRKRAFSRQRRKGTDPDIAEGLEFGALFLLEKVTENEPKKTQKGAPRSTSVRIIFQKETSFCYIALTRKEDVFQYRIPISLPRSLLSALYRLSPALLLTSQTDVRSYNEGVESLMVLIGVCETVSTIVSSFAVSIETPFEMRNIRTMGDVNMLDDIAVGEVKYEDVNGVGGG